MQKSKQVYSDMVKHELQVESLKARVEISNVGVRIHELRVRIHEFKNH